jgi:hypothetical protein
MPGGDRATSGRQRASTARTTSGRSLTCAIASSPPNGGSRPLRGPRDSSTSVRIEATGLPESLPARLARSQVLHPLTSAGRALPAKRVHHVRRPLRAHSRCRDQPRVAGPSGTDAVARERPRSRAEGAKGTERGAVNVLPTYSGRSDGNAVDESKPGTIPSDPPPAPLHFPVAQVPLTSATRHRLATELSVEARKAV